MIVCGLYVFDSQMLGGKALRNITMCLVSSIVIRLVKLGKVRLEGCARMRSLITGICLSTSGTWSRAPVVFRVVLTNFSSSDLNYRSTNIMTTCKPCDL